MALCAHHALTAACILMNGGFLEPPWQADPFFDWKFGIDDVNFTKMTKLMLQRHKSEIAAKTVFFQGTRKLRENAIQREKKEIKNVSTRKVQLWQGIPGEEREYD